MKIGDMVDTPHGKGIIVAKEPYTTFRFGVKLDINPFNFSPAYYFPKELKIINTQRKEGE